MSFSTPIYTGETSPAQEKYTFFPRHPRRDYLMQKDWFVIDRDEMRSPRLAPMRCATSKHGKTLWRTGAFHLAGRARN